MKVPPGSTQTREYDALVKKHIVILGAAGTVDESPAVYVVSSKLGRSWIGMDMWSPADPETTTILLDKSIVAHARTLERILAHEVVHHVNYVRSARPYLGVFASGSYRAVTYAVKRVDIDSDGHGANFRTGAALINRAMNDEAFVTEFSDQSDVRTKMEKPYLVLIVPMDSKGIRLGYQWGIKPSAKILEFIHKKLQIEGEPSARLIRTTDEIWARGSSFGARAGWAMPTDREGPYSRAALRALYETGTRMRISTFGGGLGVEYMQSTQNTVAERRVVRRPASVAGATRGRASGSFTDGMTEERKRMLESFVVTSIENEDA